MMQRLAMSARRALDALLNHDLALGRGRVIAIGAVCLGLVGLADWATTYELSLNPFYLLVTIFVTWQAGWRWGLLFALLSVTNQVTLGLVQGYPHSKPHYFFISNFNKLFSALVIVALVARIKLLHERERQHSRIDFLTGALNYRGFCEALSEEIARHRRARTSFSVAYLDVDNFKAVNDSRGHKIGDDLLKAVVDVLKPQMRSTDALARLGGDEFAILLAGTDEQSVRAIVERLHRSLAEAVERGFAVTFSIGVAIFATAPATEDEVIAFADHLMYRAKATGKNNVTYEMRETEGMAKS
jgi:diguanylate cyclase (GGDEF)-like protein